MLVVEAATLVARSYQFLPPTDVCLSRSVRSGNDRPPRVVPWGALMSLHSVSCVPIISVFAPHAPVRGAYSFPYELGTCESHFTVTALLLSALNASHSDCPNTMLKNPALIV